jgi:hypothetical protein
LIVIPPPLENAAGSLVELEALGLVTVLVTVWLVDEPHAAIATAAMPPRTAPPMIWIRRLSLRMAIGSLLNHRLLLPHSMCTPAVRTLSEFAKKSVRGG